MFKYRAFISYNRNDRKEAAGLQRALEGYVLPAALRAASAGLRMDSRPIKPVFRDEDELVPGQDLPERIRRGLEQSEFLIVVCSPNAVRSEWVEKEIRDFVRLGRRQNILAVVVGGEPGAAESAREALPRALRFHVDDNGTITSQPAEPLWIDWRQGAPRSDRSMFLRIVAALLSLESLDDLIQRDARARKRQRFIKWGVAAAFVFLPFIFSLLWLQQRSAELASNSQLLALQAHESADSHDVFGSLKLSLAGLVRSDSALLGYPSEQSEMALRRSLNTVPELLAEIEGLLQDHTDDGAVAIFTSDDGVIRVWDMVGQGLLWSASGHAVTADPPGAILSPDETRLITFSHDGTAKVWETVSGRLIATLTCDTSQVMDANFTPDGSRVALACATGAIMVWDVASGSRIHTMTGHARYVFAAVFSPDGQRILSSSDDATVRVWDAVSGALLHTLQHPNAADDIKLSGSAIFSPDGKHIVAPFEYYNVDGTGESVTAIWDFAKGTLVAVAPGAVSAGYGLRAVEKRQTFSPDGSNFVTVDKTGRTLVIETSTGKIVKALGAAEREIIPDQDQLLLETFAQYSRSGVLIVTTSYGSVSLHDVRTGESYDFAVANDPALVAGTIVTETLAWREALLLFGKANLLGSKWHVALMPGGTRYVTYHSASGHDAGKSRIWKTPLALPIQIDGAQSSVSPVRPSLSSDGNALVMADGSSAAGLWSVDSGELIRRFTHGDDTILDARLSSDDKRIVTASADGSAVIWDATVGTRICDIDVSAGAPGSAIFSPDGLMIATVSTRAVEFYSASSCELRFRIDSRGEDFYSAAFAPDGKHIAIGTYQGPVSIWDMASFSPAGETQALGTQVRVEFSHDGTHLLMWSESEAASAAILEVKTGKLFGRERIHNNFFSANFTSGRSPVILGFSDGSALASDVTGAEWVSFQGAHEGMIVATGASAGGRMALTASTDRTFGVWDPSSGRLLHRQYNGEDNILFAGLTPDGSRVIVGYGQPVRVNIWRLPEALQLEREALIAEACRRMALVLKSTALNEEELAAAPFLDPVLDRDPCNPPSTAMRIAYWLGIEEWTTGFYIHDPRAAN